MTHRPHSLEDVRFLAGRDSNARTYARTFDRMFVRGSLSSIWDAEGRDYIDLLACAGALPLGHNHPYVLDHVNTFLGSGHMLQGALAAGSATMRYLRMHDMAAHAVVAGDHLTQQLRGLAEPTHASAISGASLSRKARTETGTTSS